MLLRWMSALAIATAVSGPAHAQSMASPHPPAKTASVEPPAKVLFGRVQTPIPLQARAIGFYSRGCLAGAQPLAIDGAAWQVMRLSRNRNWGHPELVRVIQRLAVDVRQHDGWPGLLVGDMSQPRGGPMASGHASHQIGLDADIWLMPMPNRRLAAKEREELSAISMLGPDNLTVNPAVWTTAHVRLIKRAASYPEVERVLVHPGIKRALCNTVAGVPGEHAWLDKVRPYWGHFDHIHVRIHCPSGSVGCHPQQAVAQADGCGKELDTWFALLTRPKPPVPAKPEPPRKEITLADLPAECRTVLQPVAPGGASTAAKP